MHKIYMGNDMHSSMRISPVNILFSSATADHFETMQTYMSHFHLCLLENRRGLIIKPLMSGLIELQWPSSVTHPSYSQHDT